MIRRLLAAAAFAVVGLPEVTTATTYYTAAH